MNDALNDDHIDTVEESYVEKINNTKDASFASLFNTPELSDILIVVNGGSEYHAHRLVLASRSEVFKAMLSPNWSIGTGSNSNESACDKRVHLQETPEAEEHFSHFLYYVYSGTVNLQLTNVAGLYTLADKYNIPCLRSSTMQYMSDHIATNSRSNQAINWLLWAQDCRNAEFEKKCFNFVINNFTVVANSVQWLDIDLPNLINVLKSSDLVVADECEVFEAVERWLLGRESTQAVVENLKAVLPYMRLPQMWPTQLVHLEQKSELFGKYRRHMLCELLDAYRFQSLPVEVRVALVPTTQPVLSTLVVTSNYTTGGNDNEDSQSSSVESEGEEETTSGGGNSITSISEEQHIATSAISSSVTTASQQQLQLQQQQQQHHTVTVPGAMPNFGEAKYKMRSYINKNFSFALELKQEGDHYGPLTFSTSKSTSFLDQCTWQWNFKLYYSASSGNGSSNKLKISTSDAYKQGFWSAGHGMSSNIGSNNSSSTIIGSGMGAPSQSAVVKRCVQIAFLIGHKKRDGFYYKQYKYMHDFSECESFELGDFFKDWNLSACNYRIKLIIVIKPITET